MKRLLLLLLLIGQAHAAIDTGIKILAIPLDNTDISGNFTINGWATSPTGITNVALYIDGNFISNLPYGEIRTGVNNLYPSYPNSLYSGYSFPYFFSLLTEGTHTVEIVAFNPAGDYNISSADITTTKYTGGYATAAQVNLDNTTLTNTARSITIKDVNFKGEIHDVILEWDQSAQNLAVTKVTLQTQTSPSRAGTWTGQVLSSIASSSGGEPCGNATVNFHVTNSNGTNYVDSLTVTSESGEAIYNGTSGVIRNFDGFFTAQVDALGYYADVTGTLANNQASGQWVDHYGCYGTWSASK